MQSHAELEQENDQIRQVLLAQEADYEAQLKAKESTYLTTIKAKDSAYQTALKSKDRYIEQLQEAFRQARFSGC